MGTSTLEDLRGASADGSVEVLEVVVVSVVVVEGVGAEEDDAVVSVVVEVVVVSVVEAEGVGADDEAGVE